MKRFLLLFALVPALMVFSCFTESTSIVSVGMRKYKFPEHRLKKTNAQSTTADKYGPWLLRWSADEMSIAIPRLAMRADGVQYDFNVLMYGSHHLDEDLILDSYFLRGQFVGAVPTFDSLTNFYKVPRRLESERWDVLRLKPNPKATSSPSLDDVWVADCAKPPGFNHVLCRLEIGYREGILSTNVLEQNLSLREEIASFLRRELDSAHIEK